MSDEELNDFERELGVSDLKGSVMMPNNNPSPSSSIKSSVGSLSATLETTSLEDIQRWEIDPSEIEVGRELGHGAFGVVYKGKLRGKDVAIKKLNVQTFDDETLAAFKQEVEIMSKLRHPNVVLFMGASFQPGNYMIVTEYMPRGSLHDLIHEKKADLSFKQRMQMAKDAALGMNWLHCSKPVFIHRDLKTSNLLVDENYTVKVADFGLAHIKKHGAESNRGSYGTIGTPLWMAPEVLQNKEYDESADLYSFGIVLWELLTQQQPFPDVDTWSTMINVVVEEQQRPEIPKECPSRLRKIIQACWSTDPARRPKFSAIIPQFDAIIVDALIHDEHGRKLWKKYFMTDKLRENVSWKNFVIAFTRYFGASVPRDPKDTRWMCFKAVLAVDERVTLEQFAKILEWFGPLTGLQILDSVEDLLKKNWFHGNLSSQDAEKKLSKQKKGTFLVRFSAREPGSYALSAVSQGGRMKHYRVYHKPGIQYMIGETECSSLDEILSKYHKELFLKAACPGSPYQDIFDTLKRNVSAGYLVPEFDSAS